MPNDGFPQLPGYRVTARLGEGGMGTVWRARQESTRREVALKLLSAGALASDRARRRFEREIELAARLEHPGIARVFDAGQHLRVYYYAMELIDGKPLDEYARSAALAVRPSVELVQRVCEAVQHAHQRGVIHRDLKPANILVTADGRPHVLDFGLAKTLIDEEDPGWTVTNAGVTAGTPAYMSPEQAAGDSHRIDTRTDVYALGVILYRLLTNDHPHELTGSRFDVLRRIVDTDIRRPRKARKDLDADLEAILMKALSRQAKDRYSTAGELGDDLARYLRGEPVLARPMTMRYLLWKQARRHRLAIAVTAAVLALIVGLTAFAFFRISQALDQSQRSLANSLLSEGDSLSMRIRPLWKAAKEKYVESRRIREELGDSTSLQMVALWAAYRASPPSVLTIPLEGRPTSIAPLPDGRRAVIGIEHHLREVDLMTGRQLRRLEGHQQAVTAVAVSPDGKSMASGDAGGTVLLWDTQKGTYTHQLTGHPNRITSLLYVADGREIITASRGDRLQRHDVASGELLKTATMEVVNPNHAIAISHLAPLPDGKRILVTVSGNRGEIWDAGLGAMERRFMMSTFGHNVSAAIVSRRGEWMVTPEPDRVTVRNAEDGTVDYYLWGHDLLATSIALGRGEEHCITGSGDSTVRVWDLRWETEDQVYTEHTAGIRGVCAVPGVPAIASVSDDQTCKVWTFNELDALFSFYPNHMNQARFSADGRMVLVVQDDVKPPELVDVATGQVLQTFRRESMGIDRVAISPDGRSVVFETDRGGLEVWDIETAKHTPLESHPADVLAIEFASDGSFAITSDGEGNVRRWNIKGNAWTLGWKQRLHNKELSQNGVTAIAILPHVIAAGHVDGRIILLDPVKGETVGEFLAVGSDIRTMRVAPDGYRVLVGGGVPDSKLRVWDTRTASPSEPWELITELPGHVKSIQCISISPDGRHAMVGDDDSRLILWDLTEYKMLREFRHHGSGFADLRFTGVDGELLLAGPLGGAVSRWDFTAPARMEKPPAEAIERLRSNPNDAQALKTLGLWHLDRGLRKWALQLLVQARAAGAEVDPLMMAQTRAHPNIDDFAGALKELDSVTPGNDEETFHLNLFRSALERLVRTGN